MERPILMPGTSGIQKGDHIYFGKKDPSYIHTNRDPDHPDSFEDEPLWRVLSETEDNTGAPGIFILSETLWDNRSEEGIYYNNSVDSDNRFTADLGWQKSDARKWCQQFFEKTFSKGEQGAIRAVSKEDPELSKDSGMFDNAWKADCLKDEKVFFLSVQEVRDYLTADDTTEEGRKALRAYLNGFPYGDEWWLRTICSVNFDAAVVRNVGIVQTERVYLDGDAARPAINLDPAAILFTSYVGMFGKKSGPEGDDFLARISDRNITAWKLTLKDDGSYGSVGSGHQGFTAACDVSGSVKPGEYISIRYNGANTSGDGREFVSVILAEASDRNDDGDKYLYYGHLAQNSESGSSRVRIPLAVKPGEYTLLVFSEYVNEDERMTDLASDYVRIPLTVVSKED